MTIKENMYEKPLLYCRDLQKLIGVTLDQVIKPLRKELKHQSSPSEILELEIQDAKNKVYEFIAQQISAICNAGEDNEELVKEFPKSEPCFQSLGIDEDTIQGFLRIRGIGFMQLLDMEDEEVVRLMTDYHKTASETECVISGLNKIRTNMDLMELNESFRDDTRELIKLVVELAANKSTSSLLDPTQSIREAHTNATTPDVVRSASRALLVSSSSSDGHHLDVDPASNTSSTVSMDTPTEAGELPSSQFLAPGTQLGVASAAAAAVVQSPRSMLVGGLDHSAVLKALSGGSGSNTLFTHSGDVIDYHDGPNFLGSFGGSGSAPLSIKDSLSVPNTPAMVKQRGAHLPQLDIGGTINNGDAGETPPASPIGKRIRPPGTPPPNHRLKLAYPLHKSRSHESNLANRVQSDSNGSGGVAFVPPIASTGSSSALPGQPASTVSPEMVSKSAAKTTDEPGFVFPAHVSSTGPELFTYHLLPASMTERTDGTARRSSFEDRHGNARHGLALPSPKFIVERDDGDGSLLSVPGLTVNSHKFETRLGSIVHASKCGVCGNRLMNFRIQHCSNCKLKVHKNCMAQACTSILCSGTYRDSSEVRSSPSGQRKISANAILSLNQSTNLRPANSTPLFQGSDSNSASSCNSSAPNSPYLTEVMAFQQSPRHSGNPTKRYHEVFDFPDKRSSPSQEIISINGTRIITTDAESTVSSNESEKTVCKGIPRLESMDSQDEGSSLVRNNSISVTLKEWDIPIECLEIHEVIGVGSFGIVYRGKWHGEVAIKRLAPLDADEAEGKARLEAFKHEVATLHKTRHENLVLFMGACMTPPHLAIVTQLSKGESLYCQLHVRRQPVAINRAVGIAIQVAKGMGYLHAKKIVHKDLKTKNIFLESNSKAVIGDFGLFDFMRLCRKADSGNYLSIPSGWLCYLAPEVIKKLNLHSNVGEKVEELPFSVHSDVYAFGTVWYELLTMDWPFKTMPPESIIYLVGKGVKQTLNLIPGPKDFKELLLQCWSYKPEDRPEFTLLVKALDRLPKLHRSPSYPVKSSGTMSRSHESLVMGTL